MSADIQEIIQITTTQLNQVFKEQDALTKKFDALRSSTKNDIQIIAKHLKSMEAKNSEKEEVISQDMQEMLETKINQTFEKLIGGVKLDIEAKIKEAFESSLDSLKGEIAEAHRKIQNFENNSQKEKDDLQILLDEKNQRLENLKNNLGQNTQKLESFEERLGKIENNEVENLKNFTQGQEEIIKNCEKQKEDLLEMIENIRKESNESNLRNLIQKEIEYFGFDNEIKQLKENLEENHKKFNYLENKNDERMMKLDENINKVQKKS